MLGTKMHVPPQDILLCLLLLVLFYLFFSVVENAFTHTICFAYHGE